jgi:hypothetical protein
MLLTNHWSMAIFLLWFEFAAAFIVFILGTKEFTSLRNGSLPWWTALYGMKFIID